MENNDDIENKIFLLIKEKSKTLSPEEIKKIITDELKGNNYEEWQIGYATERIEKKIKKENNPNESKKVFGISASVMTGIAIYLIIIKPLVAGVFSDSKSDLIIKAVKQVKSNITLPYQADDVTTIVDVTAEPNAVRFHYIFSGVDDSNLTNDKWKEYLLSKVCINNNEKYVLDQGVNMEYSAVVKDTQKTFFTSLTKEDCLNYIPSELHPLNFPDLKPVKLQSNL